MEINFSGTAHLHNNIVFQQDLSIKINAPACMYMYLRHREFSKENSLSSIENNIY